MSKFTALDERLHDYLVAHGARQDEVLRRVQSETAAMGDVAVMQIAADQGALLELLVRALGARRALEVGTFTGYSAICIARGMGEGGALVTCEHNEDYAAIARRNLDAAGLGDRVEIRLGAAADTLRELSPEEPFDFAFVDADKVSYPDYYELILGLLRSGGVAMLDNVLLGGRVLEPPPGDEGARAVAALNERISADERVDVAMLGVADGISLVRKR